MLENNKIKIFLTFSLFESVFFLCFFVFNRFTIGFTIEKSLKHHQKIKKWKFQKIFYFFIFDHNIPSWFPVSPRKWFLEFQPLFFSHRWFCKLTALRSSELISLSLCKLKKHMFFHPKVTKKCLTTFLTKNKSLECSTIR